MHQSDYLVIGGGSAGAIIANRLANNSDDKVVLLEAGESDENDQAMLDLTLLNQQSDTTEWGWNAQPGRQQSQAINYLRAKVLGGCGNHNDCAFLVPPASDFDLWVKLGADGWAAKDVAKYFSQIESQVYVETDPPVSPLSKWFVSSAKTLGLPERNFRDDICDGVGPFPLNAKGKHRQSSSVAYLHPLASLPQNLEVRCNQMATKLLFSGHRAVGCTTKDNEYHASKEVILCCGSVHTPQLMMISGIGSSSQLRPLNIPVLHDLPGVGKNLQDHVAANIVLQLRQAVPPWEITPCEVTLMRGVSEGGSLPDLLYHFVLEYRDKYATNLQSQIVPEVVKISPNVMRPVSRGELLLQSDDINIQPQIKLNYFSDPAGQDMAMILDGLKFARRLADTPPLRNYILKELHPGPDVISDTDLQIYVRQSCETVYHPAGTCKMGMPNHIDTVVGPDLRVAGIESLRICDASVFPSMVSVNINNTVMMVAEKAADLILQQDN